jgi:hypothetical protein
MMLCRSLLDLYMPAIISAVTMASIFSFGRHGWPWSCVPMELCCGDGPDGGILALGKNPKKWLAPPLASGLPLNGCMPLVAWQQHGASKRRRRRTSANHHGCANGRRRCLLLLLPWKQPAAIN